MKAENKTDTLTATGREQSLEKSSSSACCLSRWLFFRAKN